MGKEDLRCWQFPEHCNSLFRTKTKHALNSQVHIMHTGFTAGTDLFSHNPGPIKQKLLSHTLIHNHQPGSQNAVSHKQECPPSASHHTSKSWGNLTVKVDSSWQPAGDQWLAVFVLGDGGMEWVNGALQSVREGRMVEWIRMRGRLVNWKGKS